ncbi:uncharacterized protein [Aristolochia californica]|uniref:uncharacterized protein n=1 Tax=Aristolochia californica TaxID=171875 RepID=UPI0035DEB91D
MAREKCCTLNKMHYDKQMWDGTEAFPSTASNYIYQMPAGQCKGVDLDLAFILLDSIEFSTGVLCICYVFRPVRLSSAIALGKLSALSTCVSEQPADNIEVKITIGLIQRIWCEHFEKMFKQSKNLLQAWMLDNYQSFPITVKTVKMEH